MVHLKSANLNVFYSIKIKGAGSKYNVTNDAILSAKPIPLKAVSRATQNATTLILGCTV